MRSQLWAGGAAVGRAMYFVVNTMLHNMRFFSGPAWWAC